MEKLMSIWKTHSIK